MGENGGGKKIKNSKKERKRLGFFFIFDLRKIKMKEGKNEMKKTGGGLGGRRIERFKILSSGYNSG